jgi:hypothetical protein
MEEWEVKHWNPSFVIPKKGGKWRRILDCRKGNRETKISHFQMINISTIELVIQQGHWAVTLDLESAYNHIKVDKELVPYFAFRFMGLDYAFLGLPFGWSRSPELFCHTLKPAIKWIRENWGV